MSPLNTQSPATLDEKLWAAEAKIKRLETENAELRHLVEELRGLASSREAREATARAVTEQATAFAPTLPIAMTEDQAIFAALMSDGGA